MSPTAIPVVFEQLKSHVLPRNCSVYGCAELYPTLHSYERLLVISVNN